MANQCPTCKFDNSDTANYCSNCATALRKGEKGLTPKAPAEPSTRTYESRNWDLDTGMTFGARYQIIG